MEPREAAEQTIQFVLMRDRAASMGENPTRQTATVLLDHGGRREALR